MTRPRVLTLSSVFPTPKAPAFGVFVRERTARVARLCDVVVVVPRPWFPLNRLIRGERASGIPRVEWQDGLLVYHPTFFSVPRYGKWLDGLLYAASLMGVLARLRREFPFELIDAHFVLPDGVGAALLGKLFRCPVVITLRGSIVRLATYPLHRPQIRWALAAAARVLAVSESLKNVAVSLGVPADKVRVIPNGVEVEHFFPRDRSEARHALGLPAARPVLLSVGGLNEGKGHHHVVEIMPALLRQRPDLLYVIVGGDRPGQTCRPLIEQLVRQHGLGGHVMLAGERPHREIPLWLGAADLFCLASRSEGWPNVLLEALACGRPVVSTRVGGSGEIVTDERLGILVTPGDERGLARAILAALERTWDRDAMVRHAKGHSWDAAAAAVAAEFRWLMAGRNTQSELDPLWSPESDMSARGRSKPLSTGAATPGDVMPGSEQPCARC